MASRILPTNNPYAGGAVVLDSSPYTNLFIKKIQEEKAKEEAFDKYFQDFGKSINSAGMRQQDTPEFINLMNNNKQFYLQNKAAIKNPSLDNGRALSQYQSGVQEASSYVNNSKQIAQKEDLINKTIIDARKKGLPITSGVIDKLQFIRQPLNSPNWKDVNVEDLEFEKPFDAVKFSKDMLGGVLFDDKVLGSPKIDPTKKTKITTYQKEINKESLPSIRERGQYAYNENPSVMEQVDIIMQDEDKLKKLNEVFRQKYNEDIQSGGDIAAAIALSLSPMGSTRDVVTTYTPTRATVSGGSNSVNKNEYKPEYHIDAIFEEGDDEVGHITVNGQKLEGKRVSLPDEIQEKLNRNLGKGLNQKPSYFYMLNDKKTLYPVYETGEVTKSGNKIIDTREGEKISVSTSLIPMLAKTFGGQAFTKKNIFTGKSDYTNKEQNKGQQPVKTESKTVRISLNGNVGEIPEGKVSEFLKKYPNAKRL